VEYSLESYSIWQEYLGMIETHMKIFQKDENLSEYEFKVAVEDVAVR
jgi:hypothetical protein